MRSPTATSHIKVVTRNKKCNFANVGQLLVSESQHSRTSLEDPLETADPGIATPGVSKTLDPLPFQSVPQPTFATRTCSRAKPELSEPKLRLRHQGHLFMC